MTGTELYQTALCLGKAMAILGTNFEKASLGVKCLARAMRGLRCENKRHPRKVQIARARRMVLRGEGGRQWVARFARAMPGPRCENRKHPRRVQIARTLRMIRRGGGGRQWAAGRR